MKVNKYYDIKWTETALKSLKKIDTKLANKIISSVEALSTDPFKYVKKLRGYPLYSLRIGDYRVILVVDVEKGNIIILYVEHRRRAYKK